MLAVLNQSAHGGPNLIQAINTLLGPGHIDADVFVDGTSISSTFDGHLPVFAPDRTRTNFDLSTNQPANHARYLIGSNSFADYTNTFAGVPASQYGYMLDNWAYAPNVPPAQVAFMPPVLAATISRFTNAPVFGSDTGPGIEFAIPPNFKGLDTTSTLSAATAVMGGAFAAFAYQHANFLAADIKAAFRQTAANWATGYNDHAYGYGAINYDAALALTNDPRTLYLQPPYVDIVRVFGTARRVLTVYAFPQTRRFIERVMVVPQSYVWPLKNELTNTDILESGAIEVLSNNDGFISPTVLLDFSEFAPGNYYIVGFTCDARGNFSRVEPFCQLPLQI